MPLGLSYASLKKFSSLSVVDNAREGLKSHLISKSIVQIYTEAAHVRW